MSFWANVFCIWMSSLWKTSSQVSIHLYLVTSTISHSLPPSTTVSTYFIFIDFCSYHLFLRTLLSAHSGYNLWKLLSSLKYLSNYWMNCSEIVYSTQQHRLYMSHEWWSTDNRCFPCAWFNSLRVLWFLLTVQRHTCYIILLTDDFKMVCVSSVTDRWFLMGELPSIYWRLGWVSTLLAH